MSFIKVLSGSFGIALASAASLAATVPVPKVEYTAERVIESEHGTMKHKVYSAGGKERSEIEMGGMQGVMILRPDKKIGWMLIPAQKMYMELDFAQARERTGAPADEDVEITEVGKETVEGVQTTKYKMVTADKMYGGFMWFTDDGIPIKMDLLPREDTKKKSRITMTLRNLHVGDQDDALFELPAGYSKMPSFGGVPAPKG
jgi:hypothetical protein